MNQIPNNSAEFRTLVTKNQLTVEQLYNNFDAKVLALMGNTVLKLMDVINTELMTLTSVEVRAIAMDDFNMAEHNIKVITSTIKLKNLQLKEFCVN